MKNLYILISLLIGIPISLIVWITVFKTVDNSSDDYASLTNQIQKDLDKADKNKVISSDNNFDARLQILRSNGFAKEPTLSYLFPDSSNFILVHKNQYSIWFVDKLSITKKDNTKSALTYLIDIANNMDSISFDKYNCLENTSQSIASYLSEPVNKFFESKGSQEIKIAPTSPSSYIFNYVCNNSSTP
jgi:hypothetical protein